MFRLGGGGCEEYYGTVLSWGTELISDTRLRDWCVVLHDRGRWGEHTSTYTKGSIGIRRVCDGKAGAPPAEKRPRPTAEVRAETADRRRGKKIKDNTWRPEVADEDMGDEVEAREGYAPRGSAGQG